jgi:Mce-associated membrane protein
VTGELAEETRTADQHEHPPGEAPQLVIGTRNTVGGLLVAWTALVLVGVVLLGWLTWSNHRADEQAAAGRAGLARATSSVTALLSYDGATILDQLDDESRLLTGQFKRKYVTLVRTVVGPAAQKQRIVTKATIASSALIDADADRVKTLLFVNLVTTGGDSTTPAVTGSRLVVVMRHVDGKWLISSLDPV